jgi:hypothetical protein
MTKYRCVKCDKFLFEVDEIIYQLPAGMICLCWSCAKDYKEWQENKRKPISTASMPDFMQEFFGRK